MHTSVVTPEMTKFLFPVPRIAFAKFSSVQINKLFKISIYKY
ncbi:hypothetical protein [Silvanigrella sp.]